MGYKITIDGPSGAGKGYVAREVAKRLGILNIDTGAMYRAFALYCVQNNISLDDEEQVKASLDKVKIGFDYSEPLVKVFLNGVDVSQKIRTEQISMIAPVVSAIPQVRYEMIKRQRELAGFNNVVVEGRDVGSVVFKDANLKIFLTAEVEVRAKRRHKELIEKNIQIDFEEVLEDIKRRDYIDMNKEVSPLVKTEDMIEIDATTLDRKQVVDKILDLIKQKGLVEK